MNSNTRFTLMTFPQFFDGTELTLNIVVLPRNQNPLSLAIEGSVIPDAPAFAAAKLSFEARIISGLATFPNSLAASHSLSLPTSSPAQSEKLFNALAQQFKIQNLSQTNQDLSFNTDRANLKPPVVAELSVRKHLPLSYQHAFNFTSPRTRNATTDDSYRCAIRGATVNTAFKRSGDTISWGKVFGYAMRQPLLAKNLGMIYSTKLAVDASYFPHGGWLYVDLAADSDYKQQQTADQNFILRYAARIPPLVLGSGRQVFAPLLMPVLFKAAAGDPDPAPDGNYDTIFTEAAEYDDGFAKIVHAHQPTSLNPLAEENDGAHPVKDAGIRLGWDDEQILIWFMRQMSIDPTVTAPPKRIDAPLGVFGYSIDVREQATPEKPWESLTAVESKAPLDVPFRLTASETERVGLGGFSGELPYQIYPSQLDGDPAKSYWLPMYFATWNGHSMVLADDEAAQVYQTTNPTIKKDPFTPNPDTATLETGTGVTNPPGNLSSAIYRALTLSTTLRYGQIYEFRVRLRDLSGGGPANDPLVLPLSESPSNIAASHFKRFVPPSRVRLQGPPPALDIPASPDKLNVERPLIGYPAVIYTGKYADPVAMLTAASLAMAGKEAFGIPDPDVDRVEITVEVETLRMDNLLSVTGKENYVILYKTQRRFPMVATEADYKRTLNIPITYKDCKVLHLGSDAQLKVDLKLPDVMDKLTEIVLPTGRNIRITMRAICEDKDDNASYYGLVSTDPEMDSRFGRTVQMRLYKESVDESQLFLQSPVDMVRGIYLQPDPPLVLDGNILSILLGKQTDKPPTLIQRLSKELKLESSGLTLLGDKGIRAQFGCSSRIRHTLSPEGSSLTFSSNADLMNHWLCCVTLDLHRDWTWDAMASRSFVIERTVHFTLDSAADTDTEVVGDIELRHTASFESLHDPQRTFTRLVFIDAVDPKTVRFRPAPNDKEPRFPDTIEVTYTITPAFKSGKAAGGPPQTLTLNLPITTPPTQIPAIVSAGLALSPYQRNKKYSASEPRRRYLWVEFAEPIHDPQDTYFARMLAYSPDQLISNNHPDLLIAPEEPALPIDPEYIRSIPPALDATNDLAGLNAMQPMEKASDSERHYLLPLPPELHLNAAELFGFFTYEFRVGHYQYKTALRPEMSWCTAQGRFGRPLRATGIQHPAPTLTCIVNRDPDRLYVVAPYAVAVHNGQDYTAKPPRTQLWCLLYAQVAQADKRDYINVLLDDKRLDSRVQVDFHPESANSAGHPFQQSQLINQIIVANWKYGVNYANGGFGPLTLADDTHSNRDATPHGSAVWGHSEIDQLLQNYGLSTSSALSVLVVEILPTITRFSEHYSSGNDQGANDRFSELIQGAPPNRAQQTYGGAYSGAAVVEQNRSQLNQELGHHRILRSSPLTEVPYTC